MTGIKYIFRDDNILPFVNAKDADPQEIGEALAAIADVEGGKLTPKAIVDNARNPESALHRHFEWNDAAAAEKWRHQQARMIVLSLRVEAIDPDKEPDQAFYSIQDNGSAYRSVQEIRSSGDLQEKLLAGAERDLESFTVRYRVLKEICAIVETAKKVARSRRSKNENRAAA